MNRTLSRAMLAASALLLCHCAPSVTASRVHYTDTAASLQLTLAGSVDREGAVAALDRYAATVATCGAYATSITSLETRAEPSASPDTGPQLISRVGGFLVCNR